MRINTRGVFLGSKYSAQQFLKQEPRANGMRGWIVNLASMVSNIGMQGLSKLSTHPFCMKLIYHSWLYGVKGRSVCHDEDYRARFSKERDCR